MALIDEYVQVLSRHGATAAILLAGANVTLRFPTGDRFGSHTLSQLELMQLVEEIAPAGIMRAIQSGVRKSFRHVQDGVAVNVTVEPHASVWRVIVEPLTAAASAPAPAPVAAAIPPPPWARKSPAAAPVASAPAPAPPAAAPVAERPPERAPAPRPATGGASAIEKLLIHIKEIGASDLHLTSDMPPYVRLQGMIQTIEGASPWNPEQLLAELYQITPFKNRREYEERNDTDFAHAIPGVARFRANLFRDRRGPGAVFRQVPFNILTPEQIGLPKGVLDLCYLHKGLVLVVGPTGSGKSTTLATLIDHINQNRRDHIITIEDPIEFVHENKKCIVNQREVHSHTRSFKDALRAALREDPDIVLVGEMRDLETIAIAVETAETGHLVFGTLHTTTAPSTIDRIIDQFPADRQEQIRQMLSESLRGVIAQTLCRDVNGGRVAAYEVLMGSPAVSNLIREKKTFQLFSLMQTQRNQGMVTLNDSLMDLVRRGVVTAQDAYMKSVSKAELKNTLAREGIKVSINE